MTKKTHSRPSPRNTKRRESSRPAPPSRIRAAADPLAVASAYAREVINGSRPACKWVRLACQRHLDDIGRSSRAAFPYRLDAHKAAKVCRFVEALPHVKGRWASGGERIKLEPWQVFLLVSVFGWVERATGNYRFRTVYCCVPRKNAKSTLAATIGLFKFAADGEYGAEVYSGATSEKQAWEVFRPARMMAERTPAFLRAFGVTVNAKTLVRFGDGSRFEPVIGNPGDGASPSCAIVDEFHEHATDSLFVTMRTGMGARENPLMFVITTAGSDRSGPCYALQLDAQKVLEGKVTDERMFAVIYGIDQDDDWKSEDALAKANPNFGVSVAADFLREQQQGAIQSARKQNAFLTKHLNVWVNADVSWMNMAAWDKCADPSLQLDDFAGEDCYIGIDLASRIDIASKVRIFRRDVGGKDHFYCFANHYLNEGAVEREDNQHYAGWAREGILTVTPGNMTDYPWVAEDLIKDSDRFRIVEIPHDPYQGAGLVTFVQARDDWDQSATFVEVKQSVQNLSPPMKELEALVLDGRFHHTGDPVLGWMISNVVCHRDANDNIFPRKERAENKIDGAVAAIMALGRAMAADPTGSVYDKRGIQTI